MLINEFNAIADYWIAALDEYNFTQLCTRPSAAQWSVGQIYLHLVDDTYYYIEQMETCVSANKNAEKTMTAAARQLFNNNDFPDKQITGHPDNNLIPQPKSIMELRREMQKLKTAMNGMAARMFTTPFKGKAQHPGFEYLDAQEWLQLACMHFRHHLLQKKRIDAFLAGE
jgi:hypothetical protein